jgi:hypothetical protein
MSTTRCGFARYMVARILLVWYPPPSYELSQLAKLLPFFVPNLLATTQRNTKSYFPRLKQCTLSIIHMVIYNPHGVCDAETISISLISFHIHGVGIQS